MGKGLVAFVTDATGLLFQFLCSAALSEQVHHESALPFTAKLLLGCKQITDLFQYDANPMAMCTREMLIWDELYTLGYPAAQRFEVV